MNSSMHNVEDTVRVSWGRPQCCYTHAYDILARDEHRTQDTGEISPQEGLEEHRARSNVRAVGPRDGRSQQQGTSQGLLKTHSLCVAIRQPHHLLQNQTLSGDALVGLPPKL